MVNIFLNKELKIAVVGTIYNFVEPVELFNTGTYFYHPPNLCDNFTIYFDDISKYKKYNYIFVNILYPNFTKKLLHSLLAIFDLTEEELFYLKLNEVEYEIVF